MTDKQLELFKKMLSGDISEFGEDAFYEKSRRHRYFRLINKTNDEYDNYKAAWEAYKTCPLVKALL